MSKFDQMTLLWLMLIQMKTENKIRLDKNDS